MKISILFTILLAAALNAQPSTKEAKELHGYSKKICAKMSECVMKQAAKLPPEQKKMMESLFPSGDVCVQQYVNHGAAGDDKSDQRKITKEELEAMKKCMSDMSKASCESLMAGENPSSCAQFQE
ncbi:LA_2478/LA_2722/LA_4182 family protein [Leptospira sp. GIMC2001]|uniref:LA_2478/LA_2722/LA_4182 family protein n=1 Tax=Leptospira sp. GIMC2001 TaxID=1513297 RepID=UPI0023495B4F|nr:hypothetical protein [Leptospira sp. GIMC2001]WCL49783.1 hypothetical protein O4O04_02895 [Leptospira sp. GIMC2001]